MRYPRDIDPMHVAQFAAKWPDHPRPAFDAPLARRYGPGMSLDPKQDAMRFATYCPLVVTGTLVSFVHEAPLPAVERRPQVITCAYCGAPREGTSSLWSCRYCDTTYDLR